MVSALFQSRLMSAGGTRQFVKGGHQFGWKSVEDMYKRELERLKNGQIARIPKLKESYIHRDSLTHLNVIPSKVMQVRFYLHTYTCCSFFLFLQQDEVLSELLEYAKKNSHHLPKIATVFFLQKNTLEH